MAVGKPTDSLLPEEAVLPRLLLLQVPQLLGVRILYLGKLPRRVVLVPRHRPAVAHRGTAAAQAVVHVALPTQQDVVAVLRPWVSYTYPSPHSSMLPEFFSGTTLWPI